MVCCHVGDTVTFRLPKEWVEARTINVLAAVAFAWGMLAFAAHAQTAPIAPPHALLGGLNTLATDSIGMGDGLGLFFAWQQPYGLPGVHALQAGARYGWQWASLHAQGEWEDWDGLWQTRALNLGGAVTWSGFHLGAEWKPLGEMLSTGTSEQGQKLQMWYLSRYDIGVEWHILRVKAVALAVGAAYAPGQTRIWLQSQGGVASPANPGWAARFTVQMPQSEPAISGRSPGMAAMRIAYGWPPGFSLVGLAEAPWTSHSGHFSADASTLRWGAALTLPLGRWRGQSLMRSQNGLPATLGAALGWGAPTGLEF